MAPRNLDSDEAARIRERLARLTAERQALETRLAELETGDLSESGGDSHAATVTGRSPAQDKIALFRSLFGGRTDVYPKRWENARTGKSGYAPVCANEWKPRVCGKPRIRCGACPNQAFVAVTDEAMGPHAAGATLGVYPLSRTDLPVSSAAISTKAAGRPMRRVSPACRSKWSRRPGTLPLGKSGILDILRRTRARALARRLGSHLLTKRWSATRTSCFKSTTVLSQPGQLPENGSATSCTAPAGGTSRADNKACSRTRLKTDGGSWGSCRRCAALTAEEGHSDR